jgi:hypothetical protein
MERVGASSRLPALACAFNLLNHDGGDRVIG